MTDNASNVNKEKVSNDSTRIYKYKKSCNMPLINSVYDDGLVYRKEDYGVFVRFNNGNFNGLLHRSKLGKRYLNTINKGDTISVSILDIKDNTKISLRLFEQEFPELSSSQKRTPRVNSRWNSNLDKVMTSCEKVLKKQDNNRKVRCKYSGSLIYETDSYKCKESSDGEIYYFESLYNAIKYNKLKNRYMKLLLDDGSLEILQSNKYSDINEIDVL